MQATSSANDVLENDVVEMEEDAEYQRQLALFVRSSDEKAKVLDLLRTLGARLPRHRSFLDIGAGAGDLTVPLSRFFSQTTIVEPNGLQLKRLSTSHPQFQMRNEYFESSEWGPQTFDLILCSHVLYYVPENTWLKVVTKMHDLLRVGGMIIIILQSPTGEMARFFEHFTGRQVPVLPLWHDLAECFGPNAVEARYLVVEMHAATLEEMTSLGLFLLLDKKYRSQALQIGDYFAAHHRRRHGYYLQQGEIVLSITKSLAKDAELNTKSRSRK